jgi:drug/metabolite transporter (DMT)-like permease
VKPVPTRLDSAVSDPHSQRRTLVSFFVAVLFGGGNGVAIRVSNRELPPLWGAFLRFILAAVLFIAIMAALRLSLPRGRALLGATVYGLLSFGISSAFAYYSLIRLQAGLGQTLVAVIPLFTMLLAVLYRQERLRLAGVAGTVLALLGIAVMSGATFGKAVPLLSVLAVLGAALTFAQATIIVRALPDVHPVTMNAVGLTTGAAFLLVGALLTGESLRLPEHVETWLALAYMVPLGTGIVFGLYLTVLKYWTATRASYSFVLMPVITLLLSAWLDKERIGTGFLLGGLLVIAGVYVGALRASSISA